MLLDFPVIGDIVISPNSKVKDEKGNDKYDLLECDGSLLSKEAHPTLAVSFPVTNWVYSLESFDDNQATTMNDITWDGTNLWSVVETSPRKIVQLTGEGVPTGIELIVGDVLGVPRGLCFDGTHLWVLIAQGLEVHQITLGAEITGVSFPYSGEMVEFQGVGIEFMEGNFYIMDESNDIIFQYDSDGVYTGNSITLPTRAENNYLCGKDGILWYTYGQGSAKCVGVYADTGIELTDFAINAQIFSGQGMCFQGEDMLIRSSSDKVVYKYSSMKYLPDIAPLDARTPYKIVGDLT